MFYMDNHAEIEYHGGQEPIVHLEADLHRVIKWADSNNKRWAFTLSNAGACYFEDRADINQLNEINWNAVLARNWQSCRDAKQSEFLLEREFPWHLVERIGVFSEQYNLQIRAILDQAEQNLLVEVKKDWYY